MSKLEQQLGLTAVVAISMSTMIGSGLFVLPGLAAAKTGPSVWMAYVFAGLCALPATLCKAELATAMPTSGGTYVYLDRSFGPLVGTIAGLGLWLSLLLKSAFALFGLSYYVSAVADIPVLATALPALGLILLLNVRGVRGVSQFQSVVIAISIVALISLAIIAVPGYDATRLKIPFANGTSGFLAASAFVFVSYAGVTKVAAFAEEIKNPSRNLPWGMLLSLLLATMLYGCLSLILVASVDLDALTHDTRPIYTLATTVAGNTAGIVAVVVGFLTLASMANGGLLAASRFPFAMSRDDLLPSPLAILHERHITPVYSILASAIAIGAALIFLDIEGVAKLASAFIIMLFLAENVAVVVLRESGARWYRPTYRSPLYPWMQGAGVLSGLLLLFVLGPLAAIAGAAIAVPGALVFVSYGRARTERRGVVGLRGPRRELFSEPSAEIPAVTDPTSDADVVVALFGSQRSPELLVEHASALSEGGSIRVVYLTELPEQVSLDVASDDPAIRSIQRRVEAMAKEQRLSLVFEAVATRDIIRTIHELASRVQCRWLVMEWTGRSRERFTFGNPLGWLKDHLPANLAIFDDAGIRFIRKILVLAEPGPHDALVVSTAAHLAKQHGADITFARFVQSGEELTRAQAAADYLDQLKGLCDTDSDTMVVRGRSEVQAIARESASFDLLVTAERPHRSVLRKMVGGGHDRLTAAAACSVLRLQTPRSQIHAALPTQGRPLATIAQVLDTASCEARISSSRKDDLFERIAASFAEHHAGLNQADILSKLHARERTQNTAIGDGVALPHATLDTATRTHLAIFTTAEPIDYGAPDSGGVDILFATIGPPSERETHLYLLAGISTLAISSSLLEDLRAAKSGGEIAHAVESALREAT